MGGMPASKVVAFLNARQGLNMPEEETAEHKEALFGELIPLVQPIQPVVDFMYGVSGRYPLAVGSGGLKPLVLATLEALGIREHFQAVVTYEDVAHGKPAPDTYLEAARLLGVEPSRCLVFEDTPLGIESRDGGRDAERAGGERAGGRAVAGVGERATTPVSPPATGTPDKARNVPADRPRRRSALYRVRRRAKTPQPRLAGKVGLCASAPPDDWKVK